MYLRYEEDTIKITCNKMITQKSIEAFIVKHKSWILRHHLIEKFNLYNLKSMFIWGINYKVIIDESISNHVEFDQQYIRIKSKNFDEKKIEKFYKSLVLKEVEKIIDNYKHVIEPNILLNNMTYKAQLMKTRLGSCIASKRIVKVNSLLARLDKKYLKLVLFHELTHLKVSNHSKSFHTLLEKIHPNHKIINRNLKNEIKSFVY